MLVLVLTGCAGGGGADDAQVGAAAEPSEEGAAAPLVAPPAGGTEPSEPSEPSEPPEPSEPAAEPPSAAGSPTGAPPASSAPSSPPATPDLDAVAVALTPVAELDQPSAMTARPGTDDLYVAERPGVVRVLRGGDALDEPFLDVSDQTVAEGERGLLGIAFAPEGDRLYVSYTDLEGDSRLDEYAVDAERADPASRRELLRVEQPYANHNGGHVAFGPDGLLYLGLGDGGDAFDPEGNGQALDTLLGKLLRIDPRPAPDGAAYTVPPDNPFVGQPDARPEIWAYGLRNPWRFAFDAENGDLWIGDVGQDELEEIDHLPLEASRGANFGWSRFEGTLALGDEAAMPPELVGPLTEYTHEQGCSVTGGTVYRGAAVPALQGAYLYGDFCSGRVNALHQVDGEVVASADLGLAVDALVSFAEDGAGELYVLSLSGPVYRLDPAAG